MLGRKVTSNGSFICIRCRLQQRLQLSGAGAVRRPPFAFSSYTALSSFSSRAGLVPRSPLSASRIHQRYFVTESAAAPEPTEPETSTTETVDETVTETVTEAAAQTTTTTESFFETETGLEFALKREKFMTSAEFENAFSGRKQEVPAFVEHVRMRDPLKPAGTRWWKNKNTRVMTVGEDIPIAILGQPGSTLVMREVERRPAGVGRYPELAPVEPVQLDLDYILAGTDDTKVTVEEYLLNIHEMQPQDSRLISTKEFLELKDALVKGFTAPQLRSYMKHWETAQKIQGHNKPKSDRPWVVERRPWVPIIENAVETPEPELFGYILPGMTPKERDAIGVMRTCWDLSVREVAAGQGYLDVRFRDVEFALLTLGSKIWLQHIARRYLKPGKQIELFRQSKFASIMAPMHTAYSILETINLFLDNTITVKFSTSLISSSPLRLGPAILDKLGLMTSSVVRVEPSGREISVTWVELPDHERKPELEDPGEMVLRLLSYAYRTKPRTSSALVMVPEKIDGRYLPEVDCEQKLPWQERFTKWTRWTAALPISSSHTASISVRGSTPSGIIPSGVLPFPIEDPTTGRALYINGDWSRGPRTETSAIFGHVLFSHDGTESPFVTPASQPVPSVSLPHTFSPVLPSVRALCFPTNLHEEGLWHTTVVMRLIPAPDLPKEIVASAPELEIRLDADHQEVKRIISLRAITDEWTGDALFPVSQVDVQLRQTRFYELQGKDIAKHTEAIIQFLEDSDLRPWEGKISTPPNIDSIRLPLKFLSPLPRSKSLNKENVDGDLVNLDYMFGGLEIRRTITAELEGLKARYTHIEGGHRRGRLSELSLDAVPVDISKLVKGVPEKKKPEEEAKVLEVKYKRGLEMTHDLDIDVAVAALETDASVEKKLVKTEAADKSAAAAASPATSDAGSDSAAAAWAADRTVTEEEFLTAASRIATGESWLHWLGKYKGTTA